MKAYIIKFPKHNSFLLDTLAISETNAIQNFMCLFFTFSDWDEYYNQGYRCVQVEITEIKS